MRRLALLPLLVLPALVFAAPVPKETPKEKMKRLFGEVADPSDGYTFTLEGNELVVTMAANAAEGLDHLNKPPRIERETTGDFEARVVLTFAPPKKKVADAGGAEAEVVVGFCLWAGDEVNVIHGKHHGFGDKGKNADGWGSGTYVRERSHSGDVAILQVSWRLRDNEFSTHTAYHLLIRRHGNEFNFGESEDGRDWSISGVGQRYFPDTVRVGLIALNTTSAECTATFSDFVVTPLPKE